MRKPDLALGKYIIIQPGRCGSAGLGDPRGRSPADPGCCMQQPWEKKIFLCRPLDSISFLRLIAQECAPGAESSKRLELLMPARAHIIRELRREDKEAESKSQRR